MQSRCGTAIAQGPFAGASQRHHRKSSWLRRNSSAGWRALYHRHGVLRRFARYWLEGYAGLQVEIDFASEFRYRHVALVPGNPAIFVSQSGETADTLASLEFAKTQGHRVLSVVNVAGSIMNARRLCCPHSQGRKSGRRQLKRSPVNWRRLLALLSRMDEIGPCFQLTMRFRWCRRWRMFPAI